MQMFGHLALVGDFEIVAEALDVMIRLLDHILLGGHFVLADRVFRPVVDLMRDLRGLVPGVGIIQDEPREFV